MSAGKLYHYENQQHAITIKAVAAYCGVSITSVEGYEHKTTNKSSEFLQKFPVGKVPALETTTGVNLFESTAIAYYVASLAPNTPILGNTLEEKAQVLQWSAFAQNELGLPIGALMSLIRGTIPYSKPAETHFKENLSRAVHAVNNYLKTRTYLVGERITLADFVIAASLKATFSTFGDADLRAKVPNAMRFFNTIANNPKIKPNFGEYQFVEKAMTYTPPAKPAKEKKEPAAPAPPKEKAPKKQEEDDEDEEPLIAEEPKAKNPLDSLPKSDFNLEDWKRAYSNLDTRGSGGSVEWFYNKFDKEGFSIWRCDFKYPEELTLVFMSSNLITGFFNRLEASRKYLFGSVGVLGENNSSLVSGVFICRGKDIKPVVEVAPDWESYNFKAVNLDDKADKDFFEAALAWDLEIDGKKWADGKAFK